MPATDSPPPSDAGELLAADHRTIEECFAQPEGADGGGANLLGVAEGAASAGPAA
jgi:hypothetical protein